MKTCFSFFFFLALVSISFSLSNSVEAALNCGTYGTAYADNYLGGTKSKLYCPKDKPWTNGLINTPEGSHCCTTKANMDKFIADYAAQAGSASASQTASASATSSTAGVPNPGDTSGTGVPVPGSESAAVNITVSNPLKYDTVEGALTGIMSALKGIVVTIALLMIVIGGIMYIFSLGNPDKMKTAKNVILAALVGLAIILAAPAFLKEIYNLLGIGSEPTELSGALTLTQIATRILNFLLSIIGILALIVMIISGIMYLTSGGNDARMKTAKSMFVAALIGIAVAMGSLVLVSAVARFFT